MLPSPQSSRSLALLTPILVLLLGLPLSALASPAAAAHADDPADRASVVRGWASAPNRVAAGAVYTAQVEIPGGPRLVELQRRVGTSWRTVTTGRSSSTGQVLLRWSTPRLNLRTPLRIRAPRTFREPTVLSATKVVSVRRVVATVVGSLTPLLRDVLILVNKARAAGWTCGGVRYPPAGRLTSNTRLGKAALRYARWMAANDWFGHETPDGVDPGERITAAGYRWSTWGENIAAGQRTAHEVVTAWLESPGHCKNIMNRAFTEIGLGWAYDDDSTYENYWVQDFGRP